MVLRLRTILLHNAVLKVLSCIIGFIGWYIMSANVNTSLDIVAPVCFYNTGKVIIEAPEAITLTLQGTRARLYALATQGLSLHINATSLHEGPNRLVVSDTTLFLPSQIKLVNYIPLHSVIIVYPKKTKNI